MPLMIMASLGTIIMFGGLYLLNSEMIENAKGMNKQLLTVGSILIVASLVGFIIGMGSNVNVISAEMTDVDEINEEQTWASELDRTTSQENFFDTGATAWALSPVTWGLAMIIIGLVAFTTQRPEAAMDWFLPAWMPLGTAFLAAPILNDPSYFDMIFPVTILAHILLGALMMGGKIALPKCP
jgi:ABC-type antimicrobial peptide transport system permease subunit